MIFLIRSSFWSLSAFFSAYCLLLTAYCSIDCFAGTISITTQAVTRVEGDTLHVVIQVTNRGNADARQVRAAADILGGRFYSQVHPGVAPGESREFSFRKQLTRNLKGTFPMKVLVHFQDANGYPFTALTCTTFFVREKGDAGVSATAAPLSMKDDGVVQFQVRNAGTSEKQLKATLHFPNEFSCERPSLHFSLPAGGQKSISFQVRNLSALYGAGYPVFLVLEHPGGETHSSLVSSALVKIVNDGNWFRRTRWYWAGGAVFLCGFFVTAVLIRRNLVDNLI
jgi:hypothetical protein